jgi:lipoprotein-anchoring transpeptidase ErfK/SrfK
LRVRGLRIRRRGVLVAVTIAVAATAVALPIAGARSAPAAGKLEQLTRWKHVGYWVHTKYRIPVHAQHNTRSKVVTRLRRRTEDGFPEVYLVLARYVERSGRTWLKLGLPMRPNGTTGWVVKGAVTKPQRVHVWLIIDRRRLKASFYEWGRKIWSAPVGIGKQSTPTPTGLFWVREQFELTSQPFYGPYAFGTSAYANISDWPGGAVVGIHGTSLPHLVPGRPSHGCIRLHNKDVLWLAYHMPVGTPISTIN